MSFGYLVETNRDSGKIVRERDTATCGHCGLPMELPPPPSGHVIVRVASPCRSCMKFVCNVCKQTGLCKTWEKQMEESERLARMLLAMGLL